MFVVDGVVVKAGEILGFGETGTAGFFLGDFGGGGDLRGDLGCEEEIGTEFCR